MRPRLLALLLSLLLAWPSPAPADPDGDHCEAAAVEWALAAAQRQAATLQVANQALSSANHALTLEAERLRAELGAARATIDSFTLRLFGRPSDGNVTAAARTAALAELTAARARAPHDRRLRAAQRAFEEGEQAVQRREPGRAVHAFREAHELAARIQRPPAPSAGASD